MHWWWLLALAACAHAPVQVQEVAQGSFEPAPVFGGQLYVIEAGPADGPPLVLIHGLGEQGARDFDPIWSELSAHYRVLAFDLPGLARSSRQDDSYSPARYTALISAMIERHFGARAVAVFGHSMGAALAIQLAADHPEQVARLILFDVAGVLHYRQYMREVIAGTPRTAWKRFLYGTRKTLFRIGMLPAKRAKLENLALDANPVLRGFFDSGRTAAFMFIQHDFGPAIRRVRAPTLLGWGASDSVALRRTSWMLRSQLPVRDYVEFAQSGHVPMRSEPEASFAAVQSFMSAPLEQPPVVERPNVVGRKGVCERRDKRLFQGDYDTITIHRCKGVVLRHVRARELVIDASEVVLEDVQLESLDTAATFRRARVRWSGGRISADVCILTDGSAMDLGGVHCSFRSRSIQVLQPTRILASASALEKQRATALHGEYDLVRTRAGKLEELALYDRRFSQHSRSTQPREDLAGEWLVGEDFGEASLRGADLRDADVRGADLRGVTGLDQAALQGARFDADTQFPAGFSPRAHRMRGP